MIARLLRLLGIDSETFYCVRCAWYYPASHFPCE